MLSGSNIDKTYYKQSCPFCGLKYSDFKTGYVYRDIYEMFWNHSDDKSEWVYKRRRTILGKWHEIKMGFWNEHIAWCQQLKEEVPF